TESIDTGTSKPFLSLRVAETTTPSDSCAATPAHQAQSNVPTSARCLVQMRKEVRECTDVGVRYAIERGVHYGVSAGRGLVAQCVKKAMSIAAHRPIAHAITSWSWPRHPNS